MNFLGIKKHKFGEVETAVLQHGIDQTMRARKLLSDQASCRSVVILEKI